MNEAAFRQFASPGFGPLRFVRETFADLATPLSIHPKLAGRLKTHLLESLVGGEGVGRCSPIRRRIRPGRPIPRGLTGGHAVRHAGLRRLQWEHGSRFAIRAAQAESNDGGIMGVRHRGRVFDAVQFHSESILVEHGHRLPGDLVFGNFIAHGRGQ